MQLEYGKGTKIKKKRKVKQKMRKAKQGLVHEKRIRPHLFGLLNEIFSHLGFGARAFTGVEKKSQVFDSLYFLI